MSDTPKYYWSDDGETYQGSGAASDEDAFAEALQDHPHEPESIVYTGLGQHYSGSEFAPDGEDLIDSMVCRAAGVVGGEPVEDWLGGIGEDATADLTQRIKVVVGGWLKEYELAPSFYSIPWSSRHHVVPDMKEAT